MRFTVGCEIHLQLIVFAADPSGDRGYINSSPPTLNGSSTARSCPIATMCESRARLSIVESHRLPSAHPARRIGVSLAFIRACAATDCTLKTSVLKIRSALAAIGPNFDLSSEAPICAIASCTVRPPMAARWMTPSILACAELVSSLINVALNEAATCATSREMPITGLTPSATLTGSSTNWLPRSNALLMSWLNRAAKSRLSCSMRLSIDARTLRSQYESHSVRPPSASLAITSLLL